MPPPLAIPRPQPQPPTASPAPPLPLENSSSPLQNLNFPDFVFETGLHRRGDTFYLVFTRAYGMMNGWKILTQLNYPDDENINNCKNTNTSSTPSFPTSSSSTSTSTASSSIVNPPSSHRHLNPRMWLRDPHPSSSPTNHAQLSFDKLLAADPPVFKDTGISRKVLVPTNGQDEVDWGKGKGMQIEERLVQIVLPETQYVRRCAWCGGWELSVGNTDEGRWEESVSVNGFSGGSGRGTGRGLYWCGMCSRKPNLLSKYWWVSPEELDESVYFFWRLP